MKSVSYILLCMLTISTTYSIAKRPKHKPKPCTAQQNDAEKESHTYQPNPVILAGVGEIMNGALSIAQDPHNRPNIGHSVASMIHGIMSIVVEKVANKKIKITDRQAIEDYLDEICLDMSKEITEIIITKEFIAII